MRNHQSHSGRQIFHLLGVGTDVAKADEKIDDMWLCDDLMLNTWSEAKAHVLI